MAVIEEQEALATLLQAMVAVYVGHTLWPTCIVDEHHLYTRYRAHLLVSWEATQGLAGRGSFLEWATTTEEMFALEHKTEKDHLWELPVGDVSELALGLAVAANSTVALPQDRLYRARATLLYAVYALVKGADTAQALHLASLAIQDTYPHDPRARGALAGNDARFLAAAHGGVVEALSATLPAHRSTQLRLPLNTKLHVPAVLSCID